MKTKLGFTLLEVLIALFIFTILSLILVSALHNVIGMEAGTARTAARLRNVEFAVLLLSRDIEQSVNRPVTNADGREEPAFLGTSTQFVFTQMGMANLDHLLRSTMRRTGYLFKDHTLVRITYASVDQAPDAKPHRKIVLNDLTEVKFEYLAKNGRFYAKWPIEGQSAGALPRAVQVHLTIANWGKLSQLYVLSAESSKSQAKSSSPDNQS